MGTYDAMNEILVRLFRDINDIEQRIIITSEFNDLTGNDMQVMEAIGIGEAKNMTAIAKELSVTVGTLTISMNSLVKKGYVIRERGIKDRRVVYISLSEKGRKAYEHQRRFRDNMIRDVVEDLTKEELDALVRALRKLSAWFKKPPG